MTENELRLTNPKAVKFSTGTTTALLYHLPIFTVTKNNFNETLKSKKRLMLMVEVETIFKILYLKSICHVCCT